MLHDDHSITIPKELGFFKKLDFGGRELSVFSCSAPAQRAWAVATASPC